MSISKKCHECEEYSHGVGTVACRRCGETQSCPVEGPNMPDSIKAVPDLTEVRAVLSELPDETTPSSRYIKELILPRLERIREILK